MLLSVRSEREQLCIMMSCYFSLSVSCSSAPVKCQPICRNDSRNDSQDTGLALSTYRGMTWKHDISWKIE